MDYFKLHYFYLFIIKEKIVFEKKFNCCLFPIINLLTIMRSKYVLFFSCLFFLLNCNIHNKEVQPGETLARTYCGTCHLFPEPSLLNKIGWKRHALPPM